MKALFKSRLNADGLTGVALEGDGIGIARIKRERGRAPLLDACRFLALGPTADRARGLQTLLSDLHLGKSRCSTVMQMDDYQLLLVEAPDVEPTELRAAVRWRIKDLLGYHIDDAVIDVFEIPADKRPGQTRMMYAVAARAAKVRNRVDELEQAGAELEVIDIQELCLRNIAALLEEDVQGLATVYLGPQHGIIILTRQNTLYLARKLEIGANAILAATESGDRETLFSNIVLEVQRSLDYYESHFSQPPVAAVALTPGAAALPGLLTYMQGNLGVSVSAIDLNTVIETTEPLDAALQARCLTAVGAALRREEVTL